MEEQRIENSDDNSSVGSNSHHSLASSSRKQALQEAQQQKSSSLGIFPATQIFYPQGYHPSKQGQLYDLIFNSNLDEQSGKLPSSVSISCDSAYSTSDVGLLSMSAPLLLKTLLMLKKPGKIQGIPETNLSQLESMLQEHLKKLKHQQVKFKQSAQELYNKQEAKLNSLMKRIQLQFRKKL